MDLIIIIGAVQALTLSLLFLWKNNKHTGDYILSAWLGYVGLHLLYHYLLSTGVLYNFPHLHGIGIASPMLEGPFVFWYVLVMINELGKFKIKYLIHALPFLFFSSYLIFDYYLLSAEQQLVYYQTEFENPNIILKALDLFNVILGPIYVVWSLILLHKFKKTIANKFSFTERINLNWLRIVIGGLGFVWIIDIVANVLGSLQIINEDRSSHDPIYAAVSIAVYFIAIFGLKQKSIFKNLQSGKFSNSVRKESKVSGKSKEISSVIAHDEEVKRLYSLMENEKPFLDPNLNISHLSNRLSIHSYQLSKIINSQLEKNFFEFVNEFRVQEFKQLIADPKNKHISILGLAMDAGFNSKASFNRIFKNLTGMTPSQFRMNFKY